MHIPPRYFQQHPDLLQFSTQGSPSRWHSGSLGTILWLISSVQPASHLLEGADHIRQTRPFLSKPVLVGSQQLVAFHVSHYFISSFFQTVWALPRLDWWVSSFYTFLLPPLEITVDFSQYPDNLPSSGDTLNNHARASVSMSDSGFMTAEWIPSGPAVLEVSSSYRLSSNSWFRRRTFLWILWVCPGAPWSSLDSSWKKLRSSAFSMLSTARTLYSFFDPFHRFAHSGLWLDTFSTDLSLSAAQCAPRAWFCTPAVRSTIYFWRACTLVHRGIHCLCIFWNFTTFTSQPCELGFSIVVTDRFF